ncbi:MAG: hypothetical protein AAF799_07670 [Myxococcota bacterium]
MPWSDPPPWARRLWAALPWLLVTGLSLALLWPVPSGRMPLSADHTVHLTRISLFAEQLAQGQLRGWSTAWFFGTPVGELYPVLGDLLIVGIRALSFGLLSWPQAYALGFAIVFTVQGWALLRVGRALGLGPVPGLVAALLVLADVGAYREGGWMYTVTYGVWPQALSTALTWLALAELCVACETEDSLVRRRRLATTGLAMGGALLAHPMAMLSFAIGGPLLVLTVGLRSVATLRRTAIVSALAAALGLSVAAWWLVPMLSHRAWMASYGWMWLPLDRMAAQVAEGHWTQAMPTAVGMTASAGLLGLAIFGSRPARFVAAFALVQWLLASRDTLWTLRLDQLSEGFAHIQYQRFLTSAKPGLLLAAGAALGLLLRGAGLLWPLRKPWARPLAAALVAGAIGLGGWMVTGQRELSRKHDVGTIQLERMPGQPQFDGEYAQLVDWMSNERAQASEHPPYRTTVIAPRNLHWFMDAPALTGMPLYKQGFTPGDNFVHKPEAGKTGLLDALRVRYVVTTGRRGPRRAKQVAAFGQIRVLERNGWEQLPIAWLDGPGRVEVLEDDVDGGVVRVRVSDSEDGTRLVFGVGGFPRWTLERDGESIEWFEAPVLGDGPDATTASRRAGELRGGKAHGDDGTEPTLIAAQVGDGEYELRYHPRQGRDIASGLLSLVALLLCGLLAWRPDRFTAPTQRLDALIERMRPVAHPFVLGGLVVLLIIGAVVRHSQADTREDAQAFGWLDDGYGKPGRHARAGLLKTDMLILPAVLVDARRKAPAEVVFPKVTLGPTLDGWIAIDDDAAKMKRRGRHRFRVEALAPDGSATSLTESTLAHRPGRRLLSIDTAALEGQQVDLRVVITSEGKAPPPLGFDFDLGAHP